MQGKSNLLYGKKRIFHTVSFKQYELEVGVLGVGVWFGFFENY